MDPYRSAAPRPQPPAVIRPALVVGDRVRVRQSGHEGRVTMVAPDGPVFLVAFDPGACRFYFRSQLLKLAAA